MASSHHNIGASSLGGHGLSSSGYGLDSGVYSSGIGLGGSSMGLGSGLGSGLGLGSTPGPAPGGPRGSSMGPSQYGYPSTSRRKTLTRQHRSMDTVGGYDLPDQDYGGVGVSADGPLAITTSFPLSHAGGLQPNGYRAAPLSNPTSTNQAYWNLANSTQYGESSTRLPSGMSLSTEYEQLKADYKANIEKLNQTMNSIRTFWSPELKRERQLRREESARISHLEAILQSGGGGGGGDTAQLRMELMARDDRIRQLTAMLDETGTGGLSTGFSDLRIRELEDTVVQLQEMLKTKDHQMLGQIDASGRFALENALRRVDEKQSRIRELEEELCRVRLQRSVAPRDFTDKSVTNHDLVNLRMKMERSEVELSERKAELAACQTRMRAAEEESQDMKAHLQLLKEQITNREQQSSLLQGDVEALRQKLDGKNQQMEQRESRIERLEKELAGSKADGTDKLEQVRQSEMRMSQMMGRIDGLETALRDKEQELDKAKVRLLSHPDVIKEKEMIDKIDMLEREKQRLQEHIDQLRRNSEKDRMDQQETYQSELKQLRANLENLQKELADRDVLLESQNEKIGDMGRELAAAQQRLHNAMVDKGADELRKEVEGARSEVDKLLKMVRQLEKENAQLTSQCKQLQSAVERQGGDVSGTLGKGDRTGSLNSSSSMNPNAQANMKKRIEELEEALRESVSITAERELHLSQQKHTMQQVNGQLADIRRENSELRKRVADGVGGPDREQLMRAFETERRQHIEQLLELKQEALLSAIGEKDAHLALLEKAKGPREEMDTIRRHKMALMQKLKQENEKRAMIIRQDSASNVIQAGGLVNPIPLATVNVGAPIPHLTHQSPRQPQQMDNVMTTSGELDDTEGIWA